MGVPTEPKKKTLVELDADCREIVAQISATEDVTEESLKLLETAELALCEKVDAYGIVTDRLGAETEYWRSQEKRVAAARKACENASKRLKERMKWVLLQHPEHELAGDTYRFFLARSKNTIEIDSEILPDQWKIAKVELVPDRAAIEKAVDAGQSVPGVGVKTDNFSLRTGKPRK